MKTGALGKPTRSTRLLSEPSFRGAIGAMSHPGHRVEQGPQLGAPVGPAPDAAVSPVSPMFDGGKWMKNG